MQILRASILVLAAGLLAGAGAPAPVTKVVPDAMPGDVELAVIPRPKREKMGGDMIEAGRVVICAPEWDSLRAGKDHLAELLDAAGPPTVVNDPAVAIKRRCDTLVLIGSPDKMPLATTYLRGAAFTFDALKKVENREQGYLLRVARVPAEKRNVIVIASLTPQGAFYAIQTLKQIAYDKDGKVYVREGDILDWPTFPARGTKRTTGTWEYMLKSNFHYATAGNRKLAVAHFADWWMPIFAPIVEKKLLDASPAGVRRAIDWMKKRHEIGARDYAIHLDDMPRKMTPETAALFRNNYQAAVAHIVREFYKAMKRTDPKANLYFMPEPYYTVSDFEDYGRRIRAAGGIPADVGMHLCGPQVTSRAMPPDDIRDYTKAFGVTRRGIIYDNHLRDSSFGPISPRPASLAKVIIGIAPERGTATTRATRLDWAWNPEAYDPERSLLLACRELAGFENWKKAYEMVAAIERALPGPSYTPRAQALTRFRAGLARCLALQKEMAGLPGGGMAGRLRPKDPGSGTEHLVNGLIDDVVILRRALRPADVAGLARQGAKALYQALPEAGPDLSRESFVDAWLFDDEMRGVAKDLTPNGNDARVHGSGVGQAPGKFGKAVRLPGSRGNYLEAPHKARQSLSQFTVAAWIKIRNYGARYQVILHKQNKKSQRNYSLIVETELGAPYLDIYPVRGAGGRTKVTDDRWHHLAATYDGKFASFYVDGKREARNAAKGPLGQGEGPIFIGTVGPSKGPGRPSGFAGNVTYQITRAIGLLNSRKERVLKYSFKEAVVVRARTAPTLDGKLDDAVWNAAPRAGRFVVSGRGSPLPDNRQTSFRCLYDDHNLYLALRCRAGRKLAADPARRPVDDLRACAVFGKPQSFALMLDPKHTHFGNYQFELDYQGNRADGRYDVADGGPPGGLGYDSGWKTAVRVGDAGWTAEIAIPFESLKTTPKKGAVMGLQVWRGRSLWSYMPRWWGMQEPSQSGHLIFR